MAELSVPAVLGLVGMIILVGLAREWVFRKEGAAELGLTVFAGERFLHLTGGTNKGRACRVLIDLFRKHHGSGLQTAAFGSTSNVAAMLEVVDRPFLAARSEGTPSKSLSRLDRLTRLSGVGPIGWTEGANRILDEASRTPGTP